MDREKCWPQTSMNPIYHTKPPVSSVCNGEPLVGGDKGEGEEFLSKIQRALGLLQSPAPDGVGVNHGRPDVAVAVPVILEGWATW